MDEKLEQAINEAGRDSVFARARALGWTVENSPPKWVWWQIIDEVRQGKPMRSPPPIVAAGASVLGSLFGL